MTVEEKIEHLMKEVVPKLDDIVRGGRSKSREEIFDKLFRETEGENGDPGELYELQQGLDGSSDSVYCALEISDVVYYAVQSGSDELVADAFALAAAFGIQPEQALEISIKKLTFRWSRQDLKSKDVKGERKIADAYLKQEGLTDFDYSAASEKLQEIIGKSDSYRD